MDKKILITELNNHCLGKGSPLDELLKKGKFPPMWLSKFYELLEEATKHWNSCDSLPIEIVSCVYHMATFPHSRYETYVDKNKKTEEELNQLRSRCNLFIYSCLGDKLKKTCNLTLD